jgi:hypothetical protein
MRRLPLLLTALVLVGGCCRAEPPGAAEPPRLASSAERFVTQLADGHFSAAGRDFDATMTRAMPPEKLQATWESIMNKVGRIRLEPALSYP